jgi:hypothetical protein
MRTEEKTSKVFQFPLDVGGKDGYITTKENKQETAS